MFFTITDFFLEHDCKLLILEIKKKVGFLT